MRARYVGPINTTFEAPVGEVIPGEEFTIPKGREQAFLQHGHVEAADKAAKDFAKNMTLYVQPEAEPEPNATSPESLSS